MVDAAMPAHGVPRSIGLLAAGEAAAEGGVALAVGHHVAARHRQRLVRREAWVVSANNSATLAGPHARTGPHARIPSVGPKRLSDSS